MKVITNNLLLASVLLAALAFSSCSKVLEPAFNEKEIRIEAHHPSHRTRATSSGFEIGDKIGVFVVPEGGILLPYGNVVNNALYTYDGAQWLASGKYYWNEGKNNVYAYYPYSSELAETEAYTFKVSADQTSSEGYSQSDFLWAMAEGQQAGTAPVSLKFSHVLSRVLVEIVKGDDYEGELPDDMNVTLHNTVTLANIDLSNGGACKDAYAAAESIKMQKISDSTYAAVVVPQNITTRRPLVEVVMGNVSYLMEGTISFKQMYQHTITVVVTENPQQAEINIGGGIGNWN